jgi:hypothetical protein
MLDLLIYGSIEFWFLAGVVGTIFLVSIYKENILGSTMSVVGGFAALVILTNLPIKEYLQLQIILNILVVMQLLVFYIWC